MARRPDWKSGVPPDLMPFALELERQRPWVAEQRAMVRGRKLPPSRETKVGGRAPQSKPLDALLREEMGPGLEEGGQVVRLAPLEMKAAAARQQGQLQGQLLLEQLPQKQVAPLHPLQRSGSLISLVAEEDPPKIKSRKRLARDLQRSLDADDRCMADSELAASALQRISLHGLLEADLSREDAKVSEKRARLRRLLAKSCRQMVCSLAQRLEASRRRLEQHEAREAAAAEAQEAATAALRAIAAQLGGDGISPQQDGQAGQEGVEAMNSLPALLHNVRDRDGPLASAVRQVATAAQGFAATHSARCDPARELASVLALADARQREVEQARAALQQRDEQVRELKAQVAVGQQRRAAALEESTSTAYTHAMRQAKAERERLCFDNDGLRARVRQLEARLRSRRGSAAA